MNTTNFRMPSNKVRDVERYFYTELEPYYPVGEIRSFIGVLFEAYLGWDTAKLLLHREECINQSDLLKFHWAVEDLLRQRPIQHILGYVHFCDLFVEVSPAVLIPRPETEEIVLRTIESMKGRTARRVLDLCTGSGCIALALAASFPQADVYGVDVSSEALKLAERNAMRNGLDITFEQCDILHDEPHLGDVKFDLIISNPPYVKSSQRENMEANVLDYEPELALFVPDDDPLLFYHVIAQYAVHHLDAGGMLVLEINESLGQDTVQLLQEHGFDTELCRDFCDKERSIFASLKQHI